MTNQYAVLYNNRWQLCYLVPSSEYSTKDFSNSWDDEPVWADADTSAFVCLHTEALYAIQLRMPL